LDHSGIIVIAVCIYILYYVMCGGMIGVLEQRITIGPKAVKRPFGITTATFLVENWNTACSTGCRHN